jgi:WD40 repeat protein
MSGTIARVAALAIFLSSTMALSAPVPEHTEKDPRSRWEVAKAKDDLHDLRKLAEDPNPNLDELWITWQQFRTTHAGTPEWQQACVIMAHAPAPLDKLDPKQIPDKERFAWQPPGLVAVLGEHRGRTDGAVRGLAVSPDGKWIVGTGDGVWLWDAATVGGKVTLLMDQAGSGAPYFSPDGRTLAVQCGKQVCLWDMGEQPPRKRLSFNANPGVHKHTLWPKKLVPDATQRIQLVEEGKTLIAYGDYDVRWWDLTGAKPKERDVMPVPRGVLPPEERVDFAPDGRTAFKLVLYGKRRLSVLEWNGKMLRQRDLLAEGCLSPIAVSADGRTLAAHLMGGGGTLQLWDLTTEKPTPTASANGIQAGSLVNMNFSPDGKLLACVDNDFGLWLWPQDEEAAKAVGVKAGQTFKRERLPFRPLYLRVAPDRRSVVFECYDGTIRVWDLTAGKELEPPQGQKGAVIRLAFSPNGRTLAALGANGQIRLWDLGGKHPTETAVFQAHAAQGRDVQFTPDGKTLLSLGGRENAADAESASIFRAWDVTGNEPKKLAAADFPEDWFTGMTVSPNGQAVVLWGRGALPENKNKDSALARFIDLSTVGCPVLFDIRPKPADFTETYLAPLEGVAEGDLFFAEGAVFRPDGKSFLLALHNSTRVYVQSKEGGVYTEQAVINQTTVEYGCIALSPDGRRLLIAGAGWANEEDRKKNLGLKSLELAIGGIRFWDVAKIPPQPLEYLSKKRDELLLKIQFSPDGSLIAMTRLGAILELWEPNERKKLLAWSAVGGYADVKFSQDGRYLAIANANGTIYLVRIMELLKSGASAR